MYTYIYIYIYMYSIHMNQSIILHRQWSEAARGVWTEFLFLPECSGTPGFELVERQTGRFLPFKTMCNLLGFKGTLSLSFSFFSELELVFFLLCLTRETQKKLHLAFFFGGGRTKSSHLWLRLAGPGVQGSWSLSERPSFPRESWLARGSPGWFIDVSPVFFLDLSGGEH